MKKTMLSVMALCALAFSSAASAVTAGVDKVTAVATSVPAKVEFGLRVLAELAYRHITNYAARTGVMLGANSLSGLITTIYSASDQVAREMVGFIPAVSADMNYTRAAVGQEVTSPVAPAATATDITPAVTPPNDGDQNIGKKGVVITKARRVPIRWNGEEQLALDNNGASYNVILRDQIAQSMRTLVNEVESDLAALYVKASRACGSAGVAPFATAGDLTDTAGALRILEENGAQGLDFQLVLGSAAMVNLRGKQSGLFKVNEAGREDMLRNGMTDRLQGFALRNSSGIKLHTKARPPPPPPTPQATSAPPSSPWLRLAPALAGRRHHHLRWRHQPVRCCKWRCRCVQRRHDHPGGTRPAEGDPCCCDRDYRGRFGLPQHVLRSLGNSTGDPRTSAAETGRFGGRPHAGHRPADRPDLRDQHVRPVPPNAVRGGAGLGLRLGQG
jgi:hypothetical protein